MAASAELNAVPLLLSWLMQNSPTLALLQAVAWFDPTSLHDPIGEMYIDFDYDAEDELSAGLHVCRACFPNLYAGANALLMQGWPERDLARFICEDISAQLVIPIDSLEALGYGPPLECYGVDPTLLAEVDEPEHLIYRSRAVYALFGLAIDGDEMDGEWSTCTARRRHPAPQPQSAGRVRLSRFERAAVMDVLRIRQLTGGLVTRGNVGKRRGIS